MRATEGTDDALVLNSGLQIVSQVFQVMPKRTKKVVVCYKIVEGLFSKIYIPLLFTCLHE